MRNSIHPLPTPLRHAALLALLLASPSMMAQEVAAQRVVPIVAEPRHRPVHNDGELWVLDVQVLPGDTTHYHIHDAPILYTFMDNSPTANQILGGEWTGGAAGAQGPAGGRVSSNTGYATEVYIHRISNTGDHRFRILALANYGPGESNLTGSRPDGLPVEPTLENPWFRSYRLELAPGEETPEHLHRHPALIIQVSDGRAQVTRSDGFGADLTMAGHWTWREAESPYRLRNVGSAPVTVVVNEGRRYSP